MSKSWMMVGVALIGALVGCDGDPQLVKPATQGQRGEACQARNDCQSGLACTGAGICSKNDFNITVTAKQCDRIDCSMDQDCCGDRPLTTPAKCADRESICTPIIPGCSQFSGDICANNTACGSGTCGTGRCSNTFEVCTATSECADTCDTVNGYCALSFDSCTTDADCGGTCNNRTCNCNNPLYAPSNPICSDEDCTDICELRCQDERCVQDTSCDEDIDCLIRGLQHCTSGGQCVECETATADTDCDGDGEVCTDGECVVPCEKNEECPLFHQCQSGDCVETGCTSDRECILAFSTGGSSQDARLSKCLPSDADPTINTCKVPCENDAACPRDFEVCSAGYCTFIGCESNEDCRAFLGIEEQMSTDSRPWISTAECRDPAVTP